ncbi:MAG: glycoside hydrolase family 88 protein [Bacteroidota bacterium]
MRKTLFLFLPLCFGLCYSHAQIGQLHADSIYSRMQKVADWQWKKLETEGWKDPKKDWTSAVMYTGMVAFSRLADTNLYYSKLLRTGKENNWEIGKYRYFADDYCVGQTYAQLYEIYKDPAFIRDLKSMADSLVQLPHTSSLEWKNSIYLREWAWCDALFMGPPALGYLSAATGNTAYRDTAISLWWKTTSYLFDTEEHLYYRDSRYFSKKEKNGAKVFWSRGNGWVIAGLTRLLSTTPKDHTERKKLVKLFGEMVSALAKLQQPDGTWHASLLDPQSYPSKETSGTGLICYAMAWGVNNGLIKLSDYEPVISKAWEALTSSVHTNGKLGFVQPQGAAPDKVGFDDTDVFGVGAFLLAGSEIFRLSLQNRNQAFIAEAQNNTPATKEEVIHVPWKVIAKKTGNKRLKDLVVKDAASGKMIPVNVSYSGKKPTEINFKAALTEGCSRFFEITNN